MSEGVRVGLSLATASECGSIVFSEVSEWVRVSELRLGNCEWVKWIIFGKVNEWVSEWASAWSLVEEVDNLWWSACVGYWVSGSAWEWVRKWMNEWVSELVRMLNELLLDTHTHTHTHTRRHTHTHTHTQTTKYEPKLSSVPLGNKLSSSSSENRPIGRPKKKSCANQAEKR